MSAFESSGRKAGRVWSRQDEEYVADFYLLAKRALTPAEWKLFRLRYLEKRPFSAAEWDLLWYAVARIEAVCGQAFAVDRTLRPVSR